MCVKCVKLHTFCAISKQFLSRIHWKILHLTEFFYTTSGCDGCDKYEAVTAVLIEHAKNYAGCCANFVCVCAQAHKLAQLC